MSKYKSVENKDKEEEELEGRKFLKRQQILRKTVTNKSKKKRIKKD